MSRRERLLRDIRTREILTELRDALRVDLLADAQNRRRDLLEHLSRHFDDERAWLELDGLEARIEQLKAAE